MGGNGGMVETDETFIGNDPDRPKALKARGYQHKMKVLSLVDRSTGRSKSMVIKDRNAKAILPILKANIAKEATVLTEDAGYHQKLAADFAVHFFVNHSAGQYMNFAMPEIYTNTIKGFFSIFKRGMRGIYQHCSKRHLHRYMAEFDLCHSNRVVLGINNAARADAALMGVVGKRLTYETIGA
jgi:transposase-like protein